MCIRDSSILMLNGNLVSTGTSKLLRANNVELAPKARVDLGGLERTFDVTGTLEVGTPGAPVEITNGDLTKTGTGSLILRGDHTYLGPTKIEAGTLVLTGNLNGTASINVAAGAKFDVSGVPGGYGLNGGKTLSGEGLIDGSVIAGGVISPGTNGLGTLHFSSTLLLAGNVNLEINLTGLTSLSDMVEAAGNLNYGGVLNVTSIGQSPTNGTVFNLFDAPTFSGSFLALNLPGLDNGLFWDTSNLTLDGTIVVVPEPGSCTAIAAGLALSIGAIRPRRRAGSCKAPH